MKSFLPGNAAFVSCEYIVDYKITVCQLQCVFTGFLIILFLFGIVYLPEVDYN